MVVLVQVALLMSLQANADQGSIHNNCLPGSTAITKKVTHYMIPLLDSYSTKICDKMEGTCIYKKKKVDYIHNFGRSDIRLSEALCKNGWGNQQNCLHPCRTIAASTKYHDFGQIIYIKDLVGHKCGNLKRDGYEMVHDGFVVVTDTGSPKYFNAPGRFDFFWGRCRNQKNGVCLEGAEDLSDAITNKEYCMIWDPKKPEMNQDFKDAFIDTVQREDRARGDDGAANDFQL